MIYLPKLDHCQHFYIFPPAIFFLYVTNDSALALHPHAPGVDPCHCSYLRPGKASWDQAFGSASVQSLILPQAQHVLASTIYRWSQWLPAVRPEQAVLSPLGCPQSSWASWHRGPFVSDVFPAKPWSSLRADRINIHLSWHTHTHTYTHLLWHLHHSVTSVPHVNSSFFLSDFVLWQWPLLPLALLSPVTPVCITNSMIPQSINHKSCTF